MEAKSVCCRAAHDQPDLGNLLHREICGMFALQDPVDVLRCRSAKHPKFPTALTRLAADGGAARAALDCATPVAVAVGGSGAVA